MINADPCLPKEREQLILDVARLLLPCDTFSLQIGRQPSVAVQSRRSKTESSETLLRQQGDRALLHDYLPDLMDAAPIPFAEPLPTGASTFASPHDGVESLLQRLALFERVYVQVPFMPEDFPRWAGASLDEFLAALPTGRVIPVFLHTPDRYEPGLATRILEGGAPRVVLHGEITLRSVRAVLADHPLLRIIISDEGASIRSALASETNEQVLPFRRYAEAISAVASRFAMAALQGPSTGLAWFPIAEWLDAFGQEMGLPSRWLELDTAIEHRGITEAVNGTPVSMAGHYLDGYLRFVYGAWPGDSTLLRIPDPGIIGRICFPDTHGLTVREFAESFRGSVVTAMHELMSSHRVQTAEGNMDLVKQFNDELKQFSRRIDGALAATGMIFTLVGLVGGLGVPAALGGLSLELARRVLGRRAPGWLATLSAGVTRSTREAALFARIKKG